MYSKINEIKIKNESMFYTHKLEAREVEFQWDAERNGNN